MLGLIPIFNVFVYLPDPFGLGKGIVDESNFFTGNLRELNAS